MGHSFRVGHPFFAQKEAIQRIKSFHKVPLEWFKLFTAKISARSDQWLPSYGHFTDFSLFDSLKRSRKSTFHISATSRPMWLKFEMQTDIDISLAPYEANLSPKPDPSCSNRGVSHLKRKMQKKGEYNEFLCLQQKYAKKLIVQPNFFSKFVLILGLYDALESSGLKSQPLMSYRNCCPT